MGTLIVNGVVSTSDQVEVSSGATLLGTGNGSTTGLVGNVSLQGGTISPGTTAGAIGTLTAETLSVSSGTIQFILGVNGNKAAAGDELVVNGTADFTGATTFNVSIQPGQSLAVGTYTLLASSGLDAGQPISGGGVAPGVPPVINLPTIAGETILVDYFSEPNDLLLDVSARTAANLLWTGSNNSTWDARTSPNWLNTANGTAATFVPGDNVTFNDASANGNYNVNVAAGGILAGSVTVNTTATYIR
jgi:hypothetical protein